MKYRMQWKDPDIYVRAQDGQEGIISDGIVSDEDYAKMRELGIGEYIIIDVDTDAMTATVKPRKRC